MIWGWEYLRSNTIKHGFHPHQQGAVSAKEPPSLGTPKPIDAKTFGNVNSRIPTSSIGLCTIYCGQIFVVFLLFRLPALWRYWERPIAASRPQIGNCRHRPASHSGGIW